MPPVLSDCLVIELANVLAGPSVGQFFAEQGATVLKIENPRTRGDVTRRWHVPGVSSHETPPDDRSAYFCACNVGKQSLAIDLSTDDGQTVLHRLVQRADMVLSSFRPGAAQALSADYETLAAVRPSLLYGHITGYGPDSSRAGYDAVIQAETGFMHMNGAADGPPTKLPVALMDVLAAHQLKEGLLLALLRRERTGDGAYVPVSLEQAAVSALANQATNWLVGGHVPQRMGSAHPNIMPYGSAYATADGTNVVLAVGTDRQFAALCDVLERPAWAEDPRFATNAARVDHRDALHKRLSERLAQMNVDVLLPALHDRSIPAGIVRDIPGVFEQPGAHAMALRSAHNLTGLRQTATLAFAPPDDMRPPPHYAAHTRSVLREHLGLSNEQVQALAETGVIVCRDDKGA